MDEALLPWQAPIWARLRSQIESGKLPHALLICGPADAGKHLLVEHLTAYLLCQSDSPVCGSCAQCQLVSAGTHPDLRSVSPEDSKQIKIDQIRDLIDWAMQTAQQGGQKLCVIEPADKMNIQSANALLKVLEEPPADTVLCLVTSQPSRILPTLRSRCQRIDCSLPSRSDAQAWLASKLKGDELDLFLDMSDGNPVRAATAIDEDYLALRRETVNQLVALGESGSSPLDAASILSKHDPEQVITVAYQLVADSIRCSETQGQVIRNSDLTSELNALAKHDIDRRFSMLERLASARGQLSGTSNPNPQMLLEWVLSG